LEPLGGAPEVREAKVLLLDWHGVGKDAERQGGVAVSELVRHPADRAPGGEGQRPRRAARRCLQIHALEGSDSTQAGQIQALQGDLAALQEPVLAIEVLPTVQKLLEKLAAEEAAATTQ
jgi:hypothetical protein